MTEPTNYTRILAMYAAMQAKAEGNLFVGSKLAVVIDLGIPAGQYTKLYYYLHELGCIETIKRGGGRAGSEVVLHKPPELDEFLKLYEGHLTRPKGSATLQQIAERVTAIERRLPDIDLKEYVLSLERRLTDIEARVREERVAS